MSTFASAWTKHARAQEFLDELIEMTDEALQRCEAAVRHSPSDDGRVHEWFMEEDPVDAQRWALLAGDVAHNARVSLDHAVRDLVIASGGVPGDQMFPVVNKRLRPSDRDVEGLAPVAFAAIEAEQPYKRDALPLELVHDMDRIDKHRILLPATTMVRGASWSGPAVDAERVFAHVPLERGGLLARFTYAAPVTEVWLNFDLEVRLSPEIDGDSRLDTGRLRRGDPTHWGLKTGVHYIGRVLERLEQVHQSLVAP